MHCIHGIAYMCAMCVVLCVCMYGKGTTLQTSHLICTRYIVISLISHTHSHTYKRMQTWLGCYSVPWLYKVLTLLKSVSCSTWLMMGTNKNDSILSPITQHLHTSFKSLVVCKLSSISPWTPNNRQAQHDDYSRGDKQSSCDLITSGDPPRYF